MMVAIKYVVVVMLENRSYDNVLGWLYNPDNAAPYNTAPLGQSRLDGLDGSESNPNPFYDPKEPISPSNEPTIPVQHLGGTTYNGLPYPATCIPIDDPGEYFEDIAQQINSLSAPASSNPYGSYDPNESGLMQGFTTNYAFLNGDNQQTPPAAAVPEVMNYFRPSQLPVTAFLARNYAVCDRWFASAPTQTFTNRAFALCAAPGVHDGSAGFSLVDDTQYADSLTELPSLLSVLDNAAPAASGPQWKVYFHDYSISMLTVPYVKSAGTSNPNNNLSTFDNSDWGDDLPHQLKRSWPHKTGPLPRTFAEDVQNNSLPPFSLIEPRYGTFNKPFGITPPPNKLPANSNHPGPGYGNVSVFAPPIDVASGELLLLQVYNMLRNSSLWPETLLIVTYDEHGGLYDHVPPPLATPPGDGVPAASCDSDQAADTFTFNVLGCRVPAIIVSPGTPPGTTIPPEYIIDGVVARPDFDHTSIIKTVWDIFGLTSQQPSLTDRDAAAPSLAPTPLALAVNDTGPYDATIVCGPSTLVFTGHGSQIAFAGCGPGVSLSATVTAGNSWLSIPNPCKGTAYLEITATVDSSGVTSSQTGTIQVKSEGGLSSEIEVRLVL
jgi:phospholipase C